MHEEGRSRNPASSCIFCGETLENDSTHGMQSCVIAALAICFSVSGIARLRMLRDFCVCTVDVLPRLRDKLLAVIIVLSNCENNKAFLSGRRKTVLGTGRLDGPSTADGQTPGRPAA